MDSYQERNYHRLVTREIEKVNSIGIATKILQFMQKIRDNSDPRYAKRWPMELLQNTKDCAFEGQKVRVEIVVRDNDLMYRNNSKPFRVKNILSLINQVTSKVEDEETTGKFGTGFMTSMLLSDCVQVTSVLSDLMDGKELPKKRFSVMLDRSADTPEGITEKIADAMVQLYRSDESEELKDFKTDEFNTEFRYELKNDHAREAALTGINELIKAAKYIFAFSGEFGELYIDVDCRGHREQFLIKREASERINDMITRHKIKYGSEDANVLVYRRGNISLAAPVGREKQILQIGDTEARLYINYPLIGSESFPFPVILQCTELMPDEPRSNIALSDNEESRDSAVNRKLVRDAVDCYRFFIDALVSMGYGGLENLVKTPVYKPYPEHSQEFVKDNIFATLLSIVASKEIVRCCDGKLHNLKEEKLYLPYGESEEVRRRIKDILADCEDIIYPEEPDAWKETLQAYDVSGIRFVTIGDMIELLDFRKIVLKEDVDELIWLQKIYDLAQFDDKIKAEIQAGRLAIYPTQQLRAEAGESGSKRGHILLTTKDMVYKDPGIMQCVKDASEVLDAYVLQPIELRKHLLAQSFTVKEDENIRGYYLGNLRNLFERTLGSDGIGAMEDRQKLEKYFSIAVEMLGYWNDPAIRTELRECGILQEDDRKNVPDGCMDVFQEKDYRVMMAYLTRYLIWCVRPHGSLECTQQWLDARYPSVDTVSFVDHLLGWMNQFADSVRLQGLAIVPSEEGVYCAIEKLSQNKIEDDELYGMVKKLGRSYDSEMVHHGIRNVDPGRVIDNATIEKYLNDFFTSLFEAEHKNIDEVSTDVQAIAILLFDWIKRNAEEAAANMPYLAGKNSFRLLNLKVVGELHEKSKTLEHLAKRLGYDLDSAEDMNSLLRKIDTFSDPEELYSDDVLEAMRMAERDAQNVCDEERDSCIYIGDFPESWRERDWEALCRWIGEQGEKFAFRYYVSYYQSMGYQSMESGDGFAVLQDAQGERVSIRLCDMPTQKQAGYDILIETQKGVKQYVEVKSRTVSSAYRNIFSLSNRQYCCAEQYGDHYTVFLALCSFHGEEDEWELRYELKAFQRTLFDKIWPDNKQYYYRVW